MSAALPLLLLTTRAGAEMASALIAMIFVLQSALNRDWRWLRSALMLAGIAWWGWTLLASIITQGDVAHALVTLRVPLAITAISHWAARDAALRRRLWLGMALACLWIGLQSWQQFLTGSNIMGWPRSGDGALTGPFRQPRAGPNFVLTLFPALLPIAGLLVAGSPWRRMAGLVLMLLAVSTAVLIGQRMPMLLVVLGLMLAALLVARLRVFAAIALAAAGLVVAATPLISPATYHKLVLRFSEQVSHFWVSSYGQLYAHAGDLIRQSPLLGIGYNRFRDSCAAMPVVARDVLTAARDGVNPCNTHPHNYYVEAAVNGGLPGMVLFCAMAVAMLVPLWRFWAAAPAAERPLAAGLLAGGVVALWPVASTSSFVAFPNLGWIIIVAALGAAHLAALPATRGDHG